MLVMQRHEPPWLPDFMDGKNPPHRISRQGRQHINNVGQARTPGKGWILTRPQFSHSLGPVLGSHTRDDIYKKTILFKIMYYNDLQYLINVICRMVTTGFMCFQPSLPN